MKKLLLLVPFAIALFVGCNKLSVKDAVEEVALQAPAADQLALQKIILEYNFMVQTEGLSDEQIQQQYDELMQLLPEEERTALVEMVEQILAQTPSNDNVTAQGVSSRATESLLSNGVAGDGFGQGVATVGNKVYVGAPQVQKVFEYSKEGGSYTLTDVITPTSSSSGFGTRVSVSGSWMAVGASGSAGKVLMFKKQGSSWVQKAILTGPANETGFGANLVLHGGKLAVTSRGQGFPDPGSTISVFEQSGNNWSLSGTIFKPGYSWFAIDMDEGGNRIVGTGGVNNNAAIVRAVIFIDNGTNWVLEDEVIVPSPVPFAIALPIDVAISNNTVVLTAIIPGTKHWVIGNNGGDWEIEQELLIPAGQLANRWAEIQESTILIGAASSNNAIPEAVHVFNNEGGSWVLSETLTPSDNGENAFMRDIAMSGNTIVAGCPQSPNTFAGKAYVWD